MKEKAIVTLFIQNDEEEILLEKRSTKKGGRYGFISGHIEKEESINEGIIRETKEELGMDIKENDLKLFYKTKQQNKSYHFYFIKKDINPKTLILQKEEVEDAKWYKISEIKDMIKKDKLYENHIEAFDIVMNYLKDIK